MTTMNMIVWHFVCIQVFRKNEKQFAGSLTNEVGNTAQPPVGANSTSDAVLSYQGTKQSDLETIQGGHDVEVIHMVIHHCYVSSVHVLLYFSLLSMTLCRQTISIKL